MATGNMPNEDQMRTIAAASRDEQAQYGRNTNRRRSRPLLARDRARPWQAPHPVRAAKFDETLAKAYGVIWEDDLFAQGGEDGRYTTNVEGFFGAQQEWLQKQPAGARHAAADGRAWAPRTAQEGRARLWQAWQA